MPPPILYAIGDIHGDLTQLQAIHARIADDLARHPAAEYEIIHIGDLVDRRENSKGVIDFLIEGQAAGKPWVAIKGNHDRMFSLFMEERAADHILRADLTWLHPRLGGLTTLESYGVTGFDFEQEEEIHVAARKIVPQSHRDYLLNLPNFHNTERAFFAHAGINPDRFLADQTEDDLLWIRKPFHDCTKPYEKLVIHGHTPVGQVTHYGNRINIDTGAAYGRILSAIVLDDSGIWQLTPEGRAEITPES